MTPPAREFCELLALARLGRAMRTLQNSYFDARKKKQLASASEILESCRTAERSLDLALSRVQVLDAEDLRELVLCGRELRVAQRHYFLRPSSDGLIAARRLESRFDALVSAALAREQGTQLTLPGMDGEEGGAT